MMENQIETVLHDLYGNGQPGLLTEVREFIAEAHGKNDTWMRVGMILSALASLALILSAIAKLKP